MVDEYLSTKQVSDIKDGVQELNDMSHIPKIVIAGNFVSYGYLKSMDEFKTIVELILNMSKDGVFVEKEVEDSLLVVMANFYDILIDCPTAMQRLDLLLAAWQHVVAADMQDKCKKHAAEVKARLQEDYKKDS